MFSVWAPKSSSVSLIVDGDEHEMTRDRDGYFSICLSANAGSRYGFCLDGGPPLPDPRSPSQPDGVHGLSQVIDYGSFEWTDQDWKSPSLRSGIIYELHVGTFSPEGTFQGVIRKIPYLKQLGVTHIELMPVNEFSGDRGWGYDGVDLYAPHHCYGGPVGLNKLVDAAHSHGLAIILDVVYNHLGPAGNYLNRFGPYFTSKHRTPWGEGVNLDDACSDQVRRFFIDNGLMWLRDYHFDGLRLDAIHALVDDSPKHFLAQLSEEIEALGNELGRELVLIAESDLNDPRVVKCRMQGGYGMNAQWSDDFHHALHAVLTGEDNGYYSDFGQVAQLAKTYNDVFVYNGIHSRSRKRVHGKQVEHLPAERFLAYSQTHDQVGNRAAGERLCHLADEARARLAAGLVLTAPFLPMLFQGEEWAASTPFQYFTDHETELGRLVSEGRRSEFVDFGWCPEEVPDPQDLETFRRSKLQWSEIEAEPHKSMLEWYRALIRFRAEHPELVGGDMSLNRIHFDEGERWIAITRSDLVTVANFSDGPRQIPSDVKSVLLASTGETKIRGGHVHLEPFGFAVCSRK
jgi:maltooligosyltrehalose trehalohydrolase